MEECDTVARLTADSVIKGGFWVQVMLLVVVDAGTLVAFSRQPVHWAHWIGFALVNAACIPVAVIVWRWLRSQRSGPLHGPSGPTEPTR